MAIKLTQGGITFNNVDRPTTQGNSKYNYANYKDKTSGEDAGRNTTEILDPVNKFINAIDIDWNSPAFSSAVNALAVSNEGSAPTSISTTGELLALLAQQQKQIDTLIIMVKGLYQGLFTE